MRRLVLLFAVVFALGCEKTSGRSSEPAAPSTEPLAPTRLAGSTDASSEPPPWQAHRVVLKDDAMWLCLPTKPAEKSGNHGSVRIVEISVRGAEGDVGIEILSSTHGPFGLDGNLPDKHSGTDLVRKERLPDKRWLFAERSKGEPWISLTVGTQDKFTEEVVCTATLRQAAGHDWPPRSEAAAFHELERICGSLRAGRPDCDGS